MGLLRPKIKSREMSQSIRLDSFALIHSRNKATKRKGKDMSGAGKKSTE